MTGSKSTYSYHRASTVPRCVRPLKNSSDHTASSTASINSCAATIMHRLGANKLTRRDVFSTHTVVDGMRLRNLCRCYDHTVRTTLYLAPPTQPTHADVENDDD